MQAGDLGPERFALASSYLSSVCRIQLLLPNMRHIVPWVLEEKAHVEIPTIDWENETLIESPDC
jgi:hypothetical protein